MGDNEVLTIDDRNLIGRINFAQDNLEINPQICVNEALKAANIVAYSICCKEYERNDVLPYDIMLVGIEQTGKIKPDIMDYFKKMKNYEGEIGGEIGNKARNCLYELEKIVQWYYNDYSGPLYRRKSGNLLSVIMIPPKDMIRSAILLLKTQQVLKIRKKLIKPV